MTQKTPAKKAPAKKAPAKKAPAKKAPAKKAAAPKAPTPAQLEAKAKKEEAAKAKALTTLTNSTNKAIKPMVTAGLKAMNKVGTGNLEWCIAAYNIKQAVEGTPVHFKDVMENEWHVQKNTATKLANAGEMLADLKLDEGEKGNWLQHMPMSNINNLSTISRMKDVKIEVGIDKGIIRIDTTEKEINAFNRDYDADGKPVLEHKPEPVPSDVDMPGDETVSESDTPEMKLIDRIIMDTAELTTKEINGLVLRLVEKHSADAIITLIEALEEAHEIVEGGA